MSSPRHSSIHFTDWRRSGPGTSGFARAEMLLGLIVIGLAGVLLFLGLGHIRQERKVDRLIADLQGFTAAFQAYRQQYHAWPASTKGETRLPRELETALSETNWD